jgi:hypothetical protein
MTTRHPLDLIEVQSPCPKNWSDMRGSTQQRFCQHCQRHVHDLSAMTSSEAEALICQSAGQLCVRFSRLRDGHIRTLDYRRPTGKTKYGARFWLFISAIVSLALAILSAVGVPPLGPTVTMGDIQVPPPPPPGATTTPPPQVTPPSPAA